MSALLLDSVILIDHLNGRHEATDFLSRNFQDCVLTPVSRAETLAGLAPGDQAPVARFLDSFPCLDIGAAEGDLAGRLRQAKPWKLPDALQMALARRNGCRLVTRNTRDFHPAKYPEVLVPYR
ncbi:MAG TPA: PIN domain-containing protein [bacterium]|nr:PIN domain-containing protein [bacterium]